MPIDPAIPNEMSLDEIVALNLASIVEERDVSIAHLARSLGVSRAYVYDMLGRRPGRPQREFRWNEIVKLAGILGVLVFDLVLPGDGVMLDAGMYLTGLTATEVWDQPEERVAHLHVGALSRNEVALALFGFPDDLLSEDRLNLLRKDLQTSKVDRAQAIADEMDSLMQGIKELEEMAKRILEEVEQ